MIVEMAKDCCYSFIKAAYGIPNAYSLGVYEEPAFWFERFPDTSALGHAGEMVSCLRLNKKKTEWVGMVGRSGDLN